MHTAILQISIYTRSHPLQLMLEQNAYCFNVVFFYYGNSIKILYCLICCDPWGTYKVHIQFPILSVVQWDLAYGIFTQMSLYLDLQLHNYLWNSLIDEHMLFVHKNLIGLRTILKGLLATRIFKGPPSLHFTFFPSLCFGMFITQVMTAFR